MEKNKARQIYPIPRQTKLIITSEENKVLIAELMSVVMHLLMDNEQRKVTYWLAVEEE